MTAHRPRRLALLALAAATVALHADPVWSCACVGTRSFREASKSAPVVVTGRVLRVFTESSGLGWSIVSHVEIDVQAVRKGTLDRRVVLVWDQMWNTSCGGGLDRITAGKTVVFATTQVSGKEDADQREMWTLSQFRPEIGDLYISGGCATEWKELPSKP